MDGWIRLSARVSRVRMECMLGWFMYRSGVLSNSYLCLLVGFGFGSANFGMDRWTGW